MTEAILDTNVLVRQLTGAPQDIALRARALLESAQHLGMELLVSPVVLAEIVYVLQSFYRWNREDIANGLLAVASGSALLVLEQSVVIDALTRYRDTRGLDFADAYVAALAVARGHGNVMSFDRDFRRLAGITIIDDPSQLGSTAG